VLIHQIILGLSDKKASLLSKRNNSQLQIKTNAINHRTLDTLSVNLIALSSVFSAFSLALVIFGDSADQGLIVVGKLPLDISGAILNIQGLELSKSL